MAPGLHLRGFGQGKAEQTDLLQGPLKRLGTHLDSWQILAWQEEWSMIPWNNFSDFEKVYFLEGGEAMTYREN
jgi:hypothetical protein